MAWVFQGNPKIFGIDDYLARYPELVYWRTPRYADRIAVGDRAFIWRSGDDAGAIAVGTVVELPTPLKDVKHPEALGDDLWRADTPDAEELKTGIHLDEIRLSVAEGAVPRDVVKSSEVLSETILIKMPNGTVFPLSDSESRELERLWGSVAWRPGSTPTASEGAMRLRAHYRRERSAWLKKQKLKAVAAETGEVHCELCCVRATDTYPEKLGEQIFEVHHRKPLGDAVSPVRTTLDDLAVLCANCHRAVHASDDIEGNFKALEAHFRK